jgi:hypothetical protein
MSVVVWILAGCVMAAIGVGMPRAAQAASSTVTTVRLDGAAGSGPLYGGIGAISGGGGNSRLLIDYPEPQRSEILDYLFRPNHGASLQVLKLEIGGDSDSSAGAEPSIEPSKGAVDCGRGYEWWLAEQAAQRNPNIKIYGLQWGAPGWVAGPPDKAAGNTTTSGTIDANGTDETVPRSLWTQDDVNYVLDWLGCARSHGLTVSYLGGWNERFTPTKDAAGVAWYEKMRAALDAHGYQNVQLVAADGIGNKWDVADEMANNPDFNKAVGVIGVHDNCGYPPGMDGDKVPFGFQCSSSTTARSLHKPIWGSEDGKLDATKGAPTLLREELNSYNQAGITGVIEYPLMTAIVDNLPLENRGLVTAKTPWSGAYHVNKVIWSLAHVTQFVPQGWRHVNGANRALGGTGSFNTFESPDHKRWSLVAHNTGAFKGQQVVPQTLHVQMRGSLAARTVHVWTTKLWSHHPSDWFVHRTDIHPKNGAFTYRVPPGQAVSLTTRTATVRKGAAQPAAPTGPDNLPTAYTAQPDETGMPKYLSPVDGSYNYEPCAGGRVGQCLGQQDAQAPVYWLHPTTGSRVPHAVVGDNSWTNYTVNSDVLLNSQSDHAGLISRFAGTCQFFATTCERGDAQNFDGYEFTVEGDGSWDLYRNSTTGGRIVLDSGTLPASLDGAWHHLSLNATGSTLTGSIDGQPVTTVNDATYGHGLAGIESNWSHVQYDALNVL